MLHFNLTMSAADVTVSSQILEAVGQTVTNRFGNTPIVREPIEAAIQNAETRLSRDNRQFASFYAGALVAKHAKNSGDIHYATNLLRRDGLSSHPFANRLASFLDMHGVLKPKVIVFGDVAPFDGWKKTKVYSEYMRGDIENIVAFAKTHPPVGEMPTILDIGTGSGVLISMIVNQLVQELELQRVRIILNDQSPGMLKSAQAYCRENIRIPCELVLSECRVEDISDDDLQRLGGYLPIWFMHGSASLHHMPRDRKIDAFRRLSVLSDHLLLAEFNGNHDLPAPNSPELYYSLAGFYGYLFGDILSSSATVDEQNVTIDQFLLAEAIIVMRSERRFGLASELGRVDYHTTPDEWRGVSDAAGYKTEKYLPLVTIEGGRPVTYFFHFEKR